MTNLPHSCKVFTSVALVFGCTTLPPFARTASCPLFFSFPFLSFPFLSFPFLSFPFLSFPFLFFSFLFFSFLLTLKELLHSQGLDYKMKSIVRHSQFNNIIQNYCKFKQNNMHIFTHHVDRLLRSRRSSNDEILFRVISENFQTSLQSTYAQNWMRTR